MLSQSEGGEFEPYLLQIRGPTQLLDQVGGVDTEGGMRTVAKSFDGNYYVRSDASVPSVYLYLQAIDDSVQSGDSGDFIFGFAKGFGGGAWAMVEGLALIAKFLLKEGFRLSPIGFPIVMTFGDRYESEFAFARSATDIVLTLARVSLAIKQAEAELILALLAGDMEEVATLSAPYVIGLQYALEILEALAQEFALSPPHLQGEIMGRAVFEIVALALTFAKVGQLSKITKVGFIDKLRTVKFFQGPRVSAVFSKIGVFLERLRTTQMRFVAGTKVHTIHGLKNIEDIEVGDLVLSRDPITGEVAYKAVLDTIQTHPRELYHVTFRAESADGGKTAFTRYVDGSEEADHYEQDELVATAEHPFYVVNRALFVTAQELAIGDRLLLADGRQAEVYEVATEQASGEKPFLTFNLEVEDFGTYFAGHLGAWVHNASAKSCFDLFARYLQLREKGRSLEQTFRVLERYRSARQIVGSVTSAANARAVATLEELGAALLEALRIEKVVAASARVWTRGRFAVTGTGDGAARGASLWQHYLKHVVVERQFPSVNNVVDYLRTALRLANSTSTTRLVGQRTVVRGGITFVEEVYFDLQSRHFAIRVISGGDDAGAFRTLFVPDGGLAEQLRYFMDNIDILL